jgi:dTDP-4-dehydrorhamnose 3,5-epimerase-like enzyme
MAKEICLKTYTDHRGSLTVIEKEIPYPIKRIFYIYGVDESIRGKHRHKTTRQFLVSIQGSCEIHNKSSKMDEWERFVLDKPSKALLLEPQDWHYMNNFSKDCILQVFASTEFDPDDYIYEPY